MCADGSGSKPMAISERSAENLAGRRKNFKDKERELETLCATKGVEYEPSSLNKCRHRTISRRQKLTELCDPSKRDHRLVEQRPKRLKHMQKARS